MQFFVDIILLLVYAIPVLYMCALLWRFWMLYINQKAVNKVNKDTIMLEIKLPREIDKSPFAMEITSRAFLQGGGIGTWYHRQWLGNLPMQFSLEIASLEGIVHFYIRTQKKFKSLIESNIYAQYPGVEIVEADDYTKLIRYHHLSKDVKLWGAAFVLGAKRKVGFDKKGKDYEMVADYIPLKTYIDYGFDKDPKEQYKNDPITPLLEFMGSVGKGEYVWYQIIIQDEAAFNDKKFPKYYFDKVLGKRLGLADLADMRKKFIRKYKKIKEGSLAFDQFGNPIQKTVRGSDDKVELQPVTYADDRETQLKEVDLTPEEKDEIELINRKLSKPLAKVILRLVYLARDDMKAFKPDRIQNVLNILRPFHGVNSFIPKPSDGYDYPWQDFMKRRVPWRGEEMYDEYVQRDGFTPYASKRDGLDKFEDVFFWGFPMRTRRLWRTFFETVAHPFSYPQSDLVFTLNVEELATMYHFPGQTANIPTLPRIDSTKGVAPFNLPQ